ncbi:MAG: hypothetical protein VW378_04665 [bacterium]
MALAQTTRGTQTYTKEAPNTSPPRPPLSNITNQGKIATALKTPPAPTKRTPFSDITAALNTDRARTPLEQLIEETNTHLNTIHWPELDLETNSHHGLLKLIDRALSTIHKLSIHASPIIPKNKATHRKTAIATQVATIKDDMTRKIVMGLSELKLETKKNQPPRLDHKIPQTALAESYSLITTLIDKNAETLTESEKQKLEDWLFYLPSNTETRGQKTLGDKHEIAATPQLNLSADHSYTPQSKAMARMIEQSTEEQALTHLLTLIQDLISILTNPLSELSQTAVCLVYDKNIPTSQARLDNEASSGRDRSVYLKANINEETQTLEIMVYSQTNKLQPHPLKKTLEEIQKLAPAPLNNLLQKIKAAKNEDEESDTEAFRKYCMNLETNKAGMFTLLTLKQPLDLEVTEETTEKLTERIERLKINPPTPPTNTAKQLLQAFNEASNDLCPTKNQPKYIALQLVKTPEKNTDTESSRPVSPVEDPSN